MPSEEWDWVPYDEGMADTWMGGEPAIPAQVTQRYSEEEPTILWADSDMRPERQNEIVRLAAAAPDLLNALETVIADMSKINTESWLPNSTVLKVKAAIEKARTE